MKKKVIVLDTTGFLAKIHLSIYDYDIYTTKTVIDEVKDIENREALDLGLDINRVKLIEPKREIVDKIILFARKIGLENKLSRTDIEVASIAYDLSREYNVVVFTDDYALQYLLSKLNIVFKPLRTIGINRNK
ncbi:MAG: hypothetical protein QXX35_04880 [Desulfurococcaceae archaeon]|uniref:Ribonuclease PIN domain-containing protein n=1 Tax=Staphylothermus marinus TaxID=2280 RepID=A0A7C4H8T1_STAMA